MTQPTKFTPSAPLKTAVLFLVFNRPDTTAQVFEAIRQAKPPRLYIAADGPRPDREGEAEKVAKVREIATAVDWPCEVKTLFRNKNLGCKCAVSGAITWFFENEEEGIILEDDCLPNQSFFLYCESMLEIYKDTESIYLVSGYNKQNEWNTGTYSYFFSNFGGIWGWASWRRAWQHYDSDMTELEKLASENYFEKLLGSKLGKARKKQLLRAKKSISIGEMDAWAYAWGFTRHVRQGIACVPSKSLVENIGFGSDATHTTGSKADKVCRQKIDFPLKENPDMTPDMAYDALFIEHRPILLRIIRKIARVLRVGAAR
jgi:hypothetical protein